LKFYNYLSFGKYVPGPGVLSYTILWFFFPLKDMLIPSYFSTNDFILYPPGPNNIFYTRIFIILYFSICFTNFIFIQWLISKTLNLVFTRTRIFIYFFNFTIFWNTKINKYFTLLLFSSIIKDFHINLVQQYYSMKNLVNFLLSFKYNN